MKKKILLILLVPFLGVAQAKISNTVSVNSISGNIALNNDLQTAVLTLVGPADRWIAMQFGQFSGGMEEGSDVVFYNGTTLIDARHNGLGSMPSTDSQNDWTVVSNTVDSDIRTIVASRAFTSADATDYNFVYNNPTIGIAVAGGNTASYALAYHGGTNRIVDTAVSFTNLSGNDFSIDTLKVFPNPSKGTFSVTFPGIKTIDVYTQTGSFVKSVKITTDSNVVNVTDLAVGVYLLEIKTEKEKTWKKIIVE